MDVLVIGGGGTLGRLVCKEVEARGHRAVPLGRRDGDLRDPEVIARPKARVIVNCAGASVALGLGHGWRGYRAVDVPIGHAAIAAAHRTNARLVYVGVHHPPAMRDTPYVDAHERVAEAMREHRRRRRARRPASSRRSPAFLPMARRGFLADVGSGNARTNPICERDLAEIIVDVALGPDGPRDVSAGGPEILSRREIMETIAAQPVGASGSARCPCGSRERGAAMLRLVHPRMGQFGQFAVGLATNDVIAPALGTTRLGDYLAGVRARPSSLKRGRSFTCLTCDSQASENLLARVPVKLTCAARTSRPHANHHARLGVVRISGSRHEPNRTRDERARQQLNFTGTWFE